MCSYILIVLYVEMYSCTMIQSLCRPKDYYLSGLVGLKWSFDKCQNMVLPQNFLNS